MMKILMKPIQVYALWREDGAILPMAFCLTGEEEKQRFAVNAVKSSRAERLAGRKTLYFDCLASAGNREWMVCLRYDIAEHRWYLHKA
jgi:hypothetical protein